MCNIDQITNLGQNIHSLPKTVVKVSWLLRSCCLDNFTSSLVSCIFLVSLGLYNLGTYLYVCNRWYICYNALWHIVFVFIQVRYNATPGHNNLLEFWLWLRFPLIYKEFCFLHQMIFQWYGLIYKPNYQIIDISHSKLEVDYILSKYFQSKQGLGRTQVVGVAYSPMYITPSIVPVSAQTQYFSTWPFNWLST